MLSMPRTARLSNIPTIGQLAQVRDQNGNPISFQYNDFGKIGERTTAAGQLTEYTYDKFGQLESIEKLMSNQAFDATQTIQYKYDKFDRRGYHLKSKLLSTALCLFFFLFYFIEWY